MEARSLWADDYHVMSQNLYLLRVYWDTVAVFTTRMASTSQWYPGMCRVHYTNVAFIILETAHTVPFSAVPTKSVPAHVFFPFTALMYMYFSPSSLQSYSKPRLKLTLLRARCRDEGPINGSTDLFIDSNRSNKIGLCSIGIHVITVSKVITDLALGRLSACQSTGWKFKKQMITSTQGKAGQSIWYQFLWSSSTRLWLTSVRARRFHLAETHFWAYLSWNHMTLGGSELQWLTSNSKFIIRYFSGQNAEGKKNLKIQSGEALIQTVYIQF